MILPEIGQSGQERLKVSRVLVVGAGGLGCPVLSYLVAAGVGTIIVADSDVVDETNLHRQPLFSESSIGRPKAEEAGLVLREHNSSAEIIPLNHRISWENVRDVCSDVDCIVDGSDNFETKYLLNDACVELGKTLVMGSIFAFEGQVSVFNAPLANNLRGPTYRCLFPEPPPVELVPSCAEAGVLGALAGVVGTLQATECLKLLLEMGKVLSGRMLVFDALSMSFSEITFQRNEMLAANTSIRQEAYYQDLSRSCPAGVIAMEAAELKQLLSANADLMLIDIRDASEKVEGDIGGELIPNDTLLSNVHRIPRDRTVVLYCRSGARCKRAILTLNREFGFTNLRFLEGGIVAWQRRE